MGRLTKCQNASCKGNCSYAAPKNGLCRKCLGYSSKKRRDVPTNEFTELQNGIVSSDCLKDIHFDTLAFEKELKNSVKNSNSLPAGLVKIDSNYEMFIDPLSFNKNCVAPERFDDETFEAFEQFKYKQNILNVTIKALEYAEKLLTKYKFSGFSIIFGWKSPGQLWHIDLRKDQYQFMLYLTFGPSTNFSLSKFSVVDSCCELGNETLSSHTVLQNNSSLFSSLNKIEYSKQSVTKGDASPGTLCVLKGGLLHAGPKYDKFRAVVFFTATLQPLELYNPSYQYNIFGLLDFLYRDTKNKKIKTEIKNNLLWTYLIQYCNRYPKSQMKAVVNRLVDSELKDIFLSELCHIYDCLDD